MPRNMTAANVAALQERRLVARDFLWIVARDRITGELVPDGTWSDWGDVAAQVINPDTGLTETRNFYGSGTLIQMSDIPLVKNMSVQNVTIHMSQINDHVEQLVRDYDVRQARVEVYRGLFDPDTRQMVAPAENRFVGFADNLVIETPSENEEGGVTLTCVSHTQEMTRANAETRSHETQVLRDPGDTFYKDAATTPTWKIWWGSQKGVVPTQKKRKKFLGIF
ncbi:MULTISPECIES: hypothetical protein [Rhizobium]|uniref:Uncharacterized protein n=1 Tax=Rhizobium favelukesii TaxID=348824 RepID=W6RPM6_9HYPH|nr:MULTISPECIES: hypothetical protein [Rhizobium]MCS0463002.1 hypothetical protein [Rhizobium favelukesii]UFS82036.1 hypothetical protein LPB79_27765 [Rhizobium sp. T136]CDM56291.1 hypothetical protein LPU83_0609 [Rhizobium favelukesii]